MEYVLSITLILLALLIGAVSPGPSFLIVARYSLNSSRRLGVAAAIGMGLGGIILAILALLGLHAVLTSIPWLYLFLKVLGGIYLVYLGFRIWREARTPLTVNLEPNNCESAFRVFTIALITQLSNPKAAIIYGSIFASLLPARIPESFFFTLPPLVFIVEAGWYTLVALTLSSDIPRGLYLKAKRYYDRVAAVVMSGLGAKLIAGAGE